MTPLGVVCNYTFILYFILSISSPKKQQNILKRRCDLRYNLRLGWVIGIAKVNKPKGTGMAIAYLVINLLLAYALFTAFETLSY